MVFKTGDTNTNKISNKCHINRYICDIKEKHQNQQQLY